MTLRQKTWLLLLILLPATLAFGIKLRISNNPGPDWSLTLTVADLTGAPGSDIRTNIESIESVDPAMEMTVSQNPGNWIVDVSRTDTLPAGVVVEVRRTADGTAGNFITGGTSYQEITLTPTELFRGADTASKVPFGFRMNGGFASLGVYAGILHTTTVTYTVTDNAW